MEDHSQPLAHVEDGAGAQPNDGGQCVDGGPDRDEDRERECEVGNHREPLAKYKWMWLAAAIAGIGGLIIAYYLYRRVNILERRQTSVEELKQSLRDVKQTLLDTQRKMARRRRRKWFRPFKNK